MALQSSQIKAETRYQARAPGAELIANVRALATLSLRRNQRRPWLTGMGCLTLAAALTILMVFIGRVDAEPSLRQIELSGALAVVGFAFLFARALDQAFDLEARRPELIARLLSLLQTDIAPEEPLTLEFDLRPEDHESKVVRTSTGHRGWTIRHCVDPWLVLQGRLRDGNRFRLDIVERARRYRRKKSSSRTPYKYKRKSTASIRVRLGVDPRHYTHLGRLGKVASRVVQLPEGTRLEALKVGADHLDMTVRVEQPWLANEPRESAVYGPQAVGMCFLNLYQLLHLSRALEQKATAER